VQKPGVFGDTVAVEVRVRLKIKIIQNEAKSLP
jgi:hypothetical protein